jgi:hypothetical protein
MRKRIPIRPRNLKPINADAAVIEQLRRFRVGLSRARDTAFYLYFPSEQDAGLAKAELVISRFDVEIHKSADGFNWLCLAMRKVVPDLEELAIIRSFLSELASRLHGQYDGWETGIDDATCVS